MFLLIEFCLAGIAIATACFFPKLGQKYFERWEQFFRSVARRRRLVVVGVGLLALGTRAALLPILPVPQPTIHDEFSYLLAADTFAHGRLTNPTHPMWAHFETFQVIQRPSYMSMYPPAQGLLLALGQATLGHPFWGVWLSVGFMCAAICWMLQAWLPDGWALLGGLLAVIRLASFSYWADSYWGGALTATGGALVLGALPRIERAQRVRDALAMGLGFAILANSRPYEGLIFSLPCLAALLAWLLRKDSLRLNLVAKRVALPLSSVLVVSAGMMGYYFWRVTGSPFRMPYQVDRETYAVAPYFIWQSLKAQPVYHNELIRAFYTHWELSQFTATRSGIGFAIATLGKINILWLFYLGPLFVLTVLAAVAVAPYGLRWNQINPRPRFLLIASLVSLGGLVPEVYFRAHYAAPMTCLIFALVLLAMRYLRRWRWRGEQTGAAIVRAVTMACIMLFVLRVAAAPLHLSVRPVLSVTWCTVEQQSLDRARVLSQLTNDPRRKLVIVHYSPQHNLHAEWVYNSADIDGSKVLWARDMGSSQNQELIRYFKDREAFLLEADETPPRLSPYSVSVAMRGQ